MRLFAVVFDADGVYVGRQILQQYDEEKKEGPKTILTAAGATTISHDAEEVKRRLAGVWVCMCV